MNEVLENFDFGHREIRQRITALWRRNCRTHGECFIVKIKGLATADRREPGTIDDHVTRFRNEALGVLFFGPGIRFARKRASRAMEAAQV